MDDPPCFQPFCIIANANRTRIKHWNAAAVWRVSNPQFPPKGGIVCRTDLTPFTSKRLFPSAGFVRTLSEGEKDLMEWFVDCGSAATQECWPFEPSNVVLFLLFCYSVQLWENRTAEQYTDKGLWIVDWSINRVDEVVKLILFFIDPSFAVFVRWHLVGTHSVVGLMMGALLVLTTPRGDEMKIDSVECCVPTIGWNRIISD